jgi:protein-tyrosine-phosphatase
MKILFICIKNASRSPMAEALLKISARRCIQVAVPVSRTSKIAGADEHSLTKEKSWAPFY